MQPARLAQLPAHVLVLSQLERAELRPADRAVAAERLDADAPVTKADVFYHLALVSNAEGDTKKAKQMVDRALSNDKAHEKAKALREELS